MFFIQGNAGFIFVWPLGEKKTIIRYMRVIHKFWKRIGLLLCSAYLVSSCVKIETKEIKYPDGAIKEKYSYYLAEGGLEIWDGKYSRWYPSGKLAEESNWNEGILHGVQTQWYENGNKKMEGNWIFGEEEGVFKKWYVNGQLAEEMAFETGRPKGQKTVWHPNGKKKSELMIVNGLEDGIENIWDDNGDVYSQRFWISGKLDSVKTYIPESELKQMSIEFEPGKKAEEFSYFLDPDGNQIRHGDLKQWYDNGQLERNISFDFGKKNGMEIWYFENGLKKSEIPWKVGKKDGVEKHWYPNGEFQKSEENYDTGILNGVVKNWYPNGKLKSEFYYVDGKLSDTAMLWFESGTLKSKAVYSEGKLNGQVISCYPIGQKKSVASFQEGVKHGKYQEFYTHGQIKLEVEYNRGIKIAESVKKWTKGGDRVDLSKMYTAVEKAQLEQKIKQSHSNCQKEIENVAELKAKLNSGSLYKELQKLEISYNRSEQKKEEECESYGDKVEEYLNYFSKEELDEFLRLQNLSPLNSPGFN